jgi:Rho-binding antiterminator
LFSRAGRDFVFLGRGQMVRLDHVLTLDGHPVAPCCPL